MGTADLDLVRRLAAAEAGLAIVSVTRTDGTVQSSLVNAGVLDHPVSGEPVVGLVVRAERATSCAGCGTAVGRAWRSATGGSGWRSRGRSTSPGPTTRSTAWPPSDVPGLLRDVFRAAGGTHDDWDEYDRVMAAERRTAVLVHPARVTTNG